MPDAATSTSSARVQGSEELTGRTPDILARKDLYKLSHQSGGPKELHPGIKAIIRPSTTPDTDVQSTALNLSFTEGETAEGTTADGRSVTSRSTVTFTLPLNAEKTAYVATGSVNTSVDIARELTWPAIKGSTRSNGRSRYAMPRQAKAQQEAERSASGQRELTVTPTDGTIKTDLELVLYPYTNPETVMGRHDELWDPVSCGLLTSRGTMLDPERVKLPQTATITIMADHPLIKEFLANLPVRHLEALATPHADKNNLSLAYGSTDWDHSAPVAVKLDGSDSFLGEVKFTQKNTLEEH